MMGIRVPETAKIIGSNLKYLREASGLSQQDVAGILEVTHQQVQKYERGTNRFPVEKLFMLRQFYNVPYDLFFRDLPEDGDLSDLAVEIGHLQAFKALEDLADKKLRAKIQKIILILLR